VEMAMGGIERAWWEERSLLENFYCACCMLGRANRAGSRCATFLSFFFDERMALRLYRIMAMTKLHLM
jgi:hypothetical protein